MKSTVRLSISTIVFVATAAAQPQILPNAVVNAASNAPVGWPNSSIAQGSIFTIYGTDLGPSSSPALAYPLQTTLGGVSIQVSSGSTTLNAIPIFVGLKQINAILPGRVPTGTAILTVTYNGQTSNAISFQVIANSFGIFAVNSAAVGVGIITGANNELYPVNSPAKPGDAATIWGTGIGAWPGDDGSAPPQQIDMPKVPVSVYVGTQQATVMYRGRSGFTGEDQINFVVPSGITGCYVPVSVEIGNIVSNFVTMPIAPAGQPCPDPTLAIPDLPTGNITLGRSIVVVGATTVTTDAAQAFFGIPQILAFPYIPPYFGNPHSLPADACIGSVTFPLIIDVIGGSTLDAGPSIQITGPNGSQQLLAPVYDAQLGGGSGVNLQPPYLDAGAYTVSGTGGTEPTPVIQANAGPFSQTFTVPQPLSWTNQGTITAVNRSAGLDVTWAGGDPNGTVQIAGTVQILGRVLSVVTFICNAKISDQHFTIPAFVSLSLPQSETSTDTLRLSTTSTTAFAASGISSGTINAVVTIVKNVTYK